MEKLTKVLLEKLELAIEPLKEDKEMDNLIAEQKKLVKELSIRKSKQSGKVRRKAAEKSLGLAIKYIHSNHPGILQDFANYIEVDIEVNDDSEESNY